MSQPVDVKFASVTGDTGDAFTNQSIVTGRCRLHQVLFRPRRDSATPTIIRFKDALTNANPVRYALTLNKCEEATGATGGTVNQLQVVNLGGNGIVFEIGLYVHFGTSPFCDYMGFVFSGGAKV